MQDLNLRVWSRGAAPVHCKQEYVQHVLTDVHRIRIRLFAPFPMQAGLHLRVYKQRAKKFLSKEEFQHPDSCISISSLLQVTLRV
jgi:hypothetical protein